MYVSSREAVELRHSSATLRRLHDISPQLIAQRIEQPVGIESTELIDRVGVAQSAVVHAVVGAKLRAVCSTYSSKRIGAEQQLGRLTRMDSRGVRGDYGERRG